MNDLPTTQEISKAVAEGLLRVTKERGDDDGTRALTDALTPDSPFAKSLDDTFAPIRQALEALAERLDRLEGRGFGRDEA